MFVPYGQPRGTLHDLLYLDTLSPDRCHILCVSQRTLYILANFAGLDCTFRSRYAVELLKDGYIPVDRDHELYELYADVVNAFQLEVLDMSCDIESGLQAIADALRAAGGSGCPSYNNPVVSCVSDLDNEQLLGPDDSEQGNPYGGGSPPEGFATWPEYFSYKCKAAHFIWDLERKHMVMLRNFEGVALVASIVAPTAAGLAGLLPAAMTPAGFAAFVAAVVAIGVVAAASWFYMDEMIQHWDDNKQAIVCSLYESGTSVEAVSALSNALEDAIQAIVSWGLLQPVSASIADLLSTAFAQLAGNGIVEPLFKSVVAATQYEGDCSSCSEPGGDLFETGQISPYDRLILGDAISANAEDSYSGYQTVNSGTVILLEWTQEGLSTEWRVRAQVGLGEVAGQTWNWNLHLNRWDGAAWREEPDAFRTGTFYTDTWTQIDYNVTEYALTDGTLYRLQAGLQEHNMSCWYRAFQGTTIS